MASKPCRVCGLPGQERLGDLRPFVVGKRLGSNSHAEGDSELGQGAESRVGLLGGEEASDGRGLDLDGASELGLGQSGCFAGVVECVDYLVDGGDAHGFDDELPKEFGVLKVARKVIPERTGV